MAEKTTTENKYGIDDAAKIMGIEAASVRVRFRNAGIRKSGSSYGWPSRGAMEAAIEKAGAAKPKAAKPAKKAKSAAPAKKPAKKAKASPAKKAKSSEGDSASA